MSALLSPELAWPARFGRFVRTLQVVVVSGAIGAVAGGAGILALMGREPPHKPAIVGAGGDNAEKALNAAKVVRDAFGSAPSPAPAIAPPAAPAAQPGSGTPQPAAAPPASRAPQSPQFAAAAASAAAAAPQPAASELYNRVEPADHSVHARSSKLRAKENKENRRAKSLASRYARERDRRGYEPRGYEPYGPSERYSDDYAAPRYYSAPRGSYWGGGNWGDD